MRLALFTGPSGGHFYPALAFAECFQARHPDAEILFVTSGRGRSLTEKAGERVGMRFAFINDFPFPRPQCLDFLIRISPFLLKLTEAFLETRRILDSFRPNLCAGFGSYVAFPGIWLGARRKIPLLIHEQNRRMGRANRWLARRANRIAWSFEPDGYGENLGRQVVTGLPLRPALLAASKKARDGSSPFPLDQFRILLLGGSQGSEALNRLWKGVIQSLSREEKSKIAVIHITGAKDFESIKDMYLAQGIAALVFPFYERMEELYPEADLALTRAGAGSLFELALFGLPAVVFPYPHADGHQEENARYFERRGGIRVFRENACTPEQLKESVFRLLLSSNQRNQMSENLRRLARPDASERMVELAEELLTGKEACVP